MYKNNNYIFKKHDLTSSLFSITLHYLIWCVQQYMAKRTKIPADKNAKRIFFGHAHLLLAKTMPLLELSFSLSMTLPSRNERRVRNLTRCFIGELIVICFQFCACIRLIKRVFNQTQNSLFSYCTPNLKKGLKQTNLRRQVFLVCALKIKVNKLVIIILHI